MDCIYAAPLRPEDHAIAPTIQDGDVFLYSRENQRIPSGSHAVIDTGWSVAIDPYEEIRLFVPDTLKNTLALVNTPCGTIDSDYTGFSIGVIVQNISKSELVLPRHTQVARGERWPVIPPPGHPNSPVAVVQGQPHLGTTFAAGTDVQSTVGILLLPKQHPSPSLYVPTDVILEIPDTMNVMLRSRSGLAAKQGVKLLPETPTFIASGVPITVPLENIGQTPVLLEKNARVAQIVATARDATKRYIPAITYCSSVEELPKPLSNRRGGYGHTAI